jgi:hypothetical protein
VVISQESMNPVVAIRKNDEVALEIGLPERHPFAPRCIHCEGRVGFVSRLMDDRIRLGMIVDRMHFRAARIGAAEAPAASVRPNEGQSDRWVV